MASSKSKSSTPAPATPVQKRIERVEVTADSADARNAIRRQSSGEDAAAERIQSIADLEPGDPELGDSADRDNFATGTYDRGGEATGTVETAAAAFEQMLADAAGDDSDADGLDFEDDADSDDENEDSENEDNDEDSENDDKDAPEGDYHVFSDEEMELPARVKVDGKWEYVPLKDVIAGYSGQAASTRRFQEAAEMRKEAIQVRTQSAEVAERLGAALTVVDQLVGQTLNDQQKQALRQLHDDATKHLETVRAREEYEILVEQNKLLREKMGWKSDTDAQRGKRELVAAAKELGFEESDLRKVYDHRLLVLLHEAHQYRQLRDKGRKARDEVRGKRRNSPGLRPGTRGARGNGNKRAQQAARSRLRQTGRIDDAASIILGMDID